MTQIEAHDHDQLFVPHAFEEHLVDLGEVRMNYAVAGAETAPALLLIPGQAESWWGYEAAMRSLSDHYRVYAVDLRGQGRSTWTPGRYTIDTIAGDLVRFLDLVVGRPAFISGLSSGGVCATWLAAFAKPGQILGAIIEDAPLFSSELTPAVGPSIRQGMAPLFAAWNTWLGDQWRIGDVEGMEAAMDRDLPEELLQSLPRMSGGPELLTDAGLPQELVEYDPEWGRAFVSGAVAASCDHFRMLQQVKVPVLYTHHFHEIHPESGRLLGAAADVQVETARRLIEAAGNTFTYRSFPDMPHSMHGADPELYVTTVHEWIRTIAPADAARPRTASAAAAADGASDA